MLLGGTGVVQGRVVPKATTGNAKSCQRIGQVPGLGLRLPIAFAALCMRIGIAYAGDGEAFADVQSQPLHGSDFCLQVEAT